MRIAHIATSDLGGGAQIAAYRLHLALRRLGHDSKMFVLRRHGDDPTVTALAPLGGWVARMKRRARAALIDRTWRRYQRTRPAGLLHFAFDKTGYGREVLQQIPSVDIVNLHFVTWLVDYRSFFSVVPRHAPVVWTLHDTSPFTGGCSHTMGCPRYADRCGSCPQLGSAKGSDLSRKIWQRKRAAYRHVGAGRMQLVAPSRWMAEHVRQSSLLGEYSVTVIPNAVDVQEFAPPDQGLARRALGIPQDASVVLTVPYPGRHKGADLLAETLSGLREKSNLWLISVGNQKPLPVPGTSHLHLGFIRSGRLLSLAYGAADVFVIPSRYDNLPSTIMESLACGTPVVGFDVGGIRDMVRPGVTGLLAPPEDVGALRAALVELLSDPERRAKMSRCCRQVAIEEYSLEVQARAYVELYERRVTLFDDNAAKA